MRGFRVGYILTLSFLLILSLVTLTIGFFPPPKGPTPPKYPDWTQNFNNYDSQKRQYDQEQKVFLQDKVVPYTKNIIVAWIVFIATFEVIGIFLVRSEFHLVGSSFAFSGVWAVIFGPLGSLVFFINRIVSSFGGRAGQTFSTDVITQSIGMTSFLAVVVLSVCGIFVLENKKVRVRPEVSTQATS